jgi:hypothetical protein
MSEAIDQRFTERAVELMRGIGVPGVSVDNVMTNPNFRAQFRAMLVDAKLRFLEGGEDHASLVRLIAECDRLAPAPHHMGTSAGLVNAGGTGFQVPRLDEQGPKPIGELVKGAGFCRYCGAGIPPRQGEGTCDRCDPRLGGDPVQAEHRPIIDDDRR